mgnify:CR=1 FL=1
MLVKAQSTWRSVFEPSPTAHLVLDFVQLTLRSTPPHGYARNSVNGHFPTPVLVPGTHFRMKSVMTLTFQPSGLNWKRTFLILRTTHSPSVLFYFIPCFFLFLHYRRFYSLTVVMRLCPFCNRRNINVFMMMMMMMTFWVRVRVCFSFDF